MSEDKELKNEKLNVKKEEIYDEDYEKKKKQLEDLKDYTRTGIGIGIMFGMVLGWMWGWKGMIVGPLIGIVVGVILALIFTFFPKTPWGYGE